MSWQGAGRVHIVGIGGAGVSAVARLLRLEGVTVSGSDGSEGVNVAGLRQLGISVTVGHRAENLPANVTLVVHSTAVPADNPELAEARRRGVRVLAYPQVLGELSRSRRTLAVAGTNGKSTTTAMLGRVLEAAGKDPAVIVGANVVSWGGANYRSGSGDLVVEACEHGEHFLQLSPWAAAVTNVAADHLDHYGTLEAVVAAFRRFVAALPADGTLVYSADDDLAEQVASSANCRKVGFSLLGRGQLTAQIVSATPRGLTLAVESDGQSATLQLGATGTHNAANALAAIGLAQASGLSLAECGPGLASYAGLSRRLELVGTVPGTDVPVISDYAHHPDAIVAAIQALRLSYPGRRLAVIFQPHQGNRTRRLMDGFAAAFAGADELAIAEIYRVPGREHGEDAQVSSRQLAEKVAAATGRKDVSYCDSLAAAESWARARAQAGAALAVIGAGDIDAVARRLVGA